MNAFITLVWHITKKDVRSLRWLIALWAALTVLQAALRAIWPLMMPWVHPDLAYMLESARTLLPLIRGLLFAEIVVLLIHADSLVRTDAFWLTRPIPPRVLFFSKLLTAAAVLIVPAFLTQAALMLAFGVPFLDIVSVTPELLIYTTAGMTVVLIGAALTVNQRELLAWTAGLIALVFAVLFIKSLVSPVSPVEQAAAAERAAAAMPMPPSSAAWADVQIVTFVLVSAGFAGTAWHLYRTRRRGRSALIAAAATGFSLFVPTMLFPSNGLRWEPRELTLAPAIPLAKGMHFEDGPRSLAAWPIYEGGRSCHLMLRQTRLQGLRVYYDRPALTYGFVHRRTGQPLTAGEEPLDRKSREQAPLPLFYGGEETEAFQIQYLRVFLFAPKEPPERGARIENLPCRDVAISVRREAFTPGD
jgi:hypothetical protein